MEQDSRHKDLGRFVRHNEGWCGKVIGYDLNDRCYIISVNSKGTSSSFRIKEIRQSNNILLMPLCPESRGRWATPEDFKFIPNDYLL